MDMSRGDLDLLLADDDILDRLRKYPRYIANRELDDHPNFDHSPNPNSGSFIQL